MSSGSSDSKSAVTRTVVLAALPSVFAVGILVIRYLLTGGTGFRFLVWNLYLAWVPVGFAVAIELLRESGRGRARYYLPLLTLWLLFLPNSPYILTDLVHLLEANTASFWYALAIILSFAFAGLMAGVASMRIVQHALASVAGPVISYGVVFSAAMLSGVGIYLGRVLRWNSWDVFTQPHVLLPQLARAAFDPWGSRHALAFSLLFGVFFTVAFLVTSRRLDERG